MSNENNTNCSADDSNESGDSSDSIANKGSIAAKPHLREIRSYMLRTGRMTPAQHEALAEYWPTFGLKLEDGVIDPAQLFGRDAELVVEIGFGMGDSLLEMAKLAPEKNFIGIEVHTPGIGRIVRGANELGLKNIKVYQNDAFKVLAQCFADNSIDTVQIFFPDPWQKKKHHKRRLIQAPLLELLEPKLRDGFAKSDPTKSSTTKKAILHIATDWQNYAEHCLGLLNTAEQWCNTAEDLQYAPRPDNRPLTKFEQRGKNLGHGVWDLIFHHV